jgi:hypothetical protein
MCYRYEILFRVYEILTGQEVRARFGRHWLGIGFQGPEPGSDTRGAGLFGLFILLKFVETNGKTA